MWIDDTQRVAQFRRGDNFCYLLVCPDTGEGLVIDPGYPDLLAPIQATGVPVTTIFNTHGHHDHVGGNAALVEASGARVARFGAGDLPLADGDLLRWGKSEARVLHTPGHLDDACCLLWDDLLFTGDTLFISSTGNAYGPENMQKLWGSLGKIEELPDATRLAVGHDYAVTALEFMLEIEPDNQAARAKQAEVVAARETGGLLLSSLAEEYQHNPFFRLHTPPVGAFLARQFGDCPDDVYARFCLLREFRNA